MMVGCAGRLEFRRGTERYDRGDFVGAYREYYNAYRLSGSETHKLARDRVGSLVAASIREKARFLEETGRIEEALQEYLHALEYDPERKLLIGEFHRVEDRIALLDEGIQQAQAHHGSWEAYRNWLELRRESVARPDVFRRLRSALLAAIDRDLDDLLGKEPPEFLWRSLPEDIPSLEALLARLRSLSSRVQDLSLEWTGGEEEMGSHLRPRRELIESAAGKVADALQAERERVLAALNENAGNFEAACATYEQALFHWPYRSRIRDGLSSAQKSAEAAATDAYVRAIARRDWEGALRQLHWLQRLLPGSQDVQKRLERCRGEIREELLREGARMRGRGLPGNALAAFFRLRAMGLGSKELDREIALLEESIQRRLDYEVRLEFLPDSEPGGRGVELDREEMRGIVEEAVLLALHRKKDPDPPLSPVSTGSLPGGARPVLRVAVRDLNFDYQLGREVAGTMKSRFVADFREVTNPEWIREQKELEVLRARVEKARAELAAAPPVDRHEISVRLEIARGEMRQKQSDMDQTPQTIPSPIWETQPHPVNVVRVRATLEIEARIDDQGERIEVSLKAEDQEVEGDIGRGIPPDRPEVPSRGDALRELAPRLAAELAARVKGRMDALRENFLREARQRLSEDSYEAAVEDLVAFLYAERREGPDARFTEAAELFEKLTGCKFPLKPRITRVSPDPPRGRF